MISGPVALLGFLLAAAVLVYFLRRLEALAALLAASASLLTAVALWKFPLATPVKIAGRLVSVGQALALQDVTLQITGSTQPVLIFLFVAAAATMVLAWSTHQGRTFYPFGLALVAVWATAALIHPLTLAPMALVLATILAVFLIQAGRAADTRGAWRQMLFPSLAVPLFFVAAWYINQAPLNPDDATPLRIAGWLIVVGFVLLLQPAPLHVAAPAVARQSPPVVAAFLWIGGQSITLFLLQRFLVSYPWLASTIDSAHWLLWLGVLTALVGGLLSAVQEGLGTYAGYAAVYDYGILLVAMALRGTAGVSMAIWLLITRTIALLTLASGIAILRHHMETDRLDQLAGAASRLPWATVAVIMGGFALAGMPLTAQYASRWALLQLVAANDVRWVVILLLGALGVLVGALRAGQACFGRLSGSLVHREPWILAVLAFGLVAVGVLLGLFPQLLSAPVAAAILPLAAIEP